MTGIELGRRFRRGPILLLAMVFCWLKAGAQTGAPASAPWPIRAVIVTTFEIGADTGDTAGEF